jgi:hypothetical protein
MNKQMIVYVTGPPEMANNQGQNYSQQNSHMNDNNYNMQNSNTNDRNYNNYNQQNSQQYDGYVTNTTQFDQETNIRQTQYDAVYRHAPNNNGYAPLNTTPVTGAEPGSYGIDVTYATYLATVVHLLLSVLCFLTLIDMSPINTSKAGCGLHAVQTYYIKAATHEYHVTNKHYPLSNINPLFFITLFEVITAAFCMAYSRVAFSFLRSNRVAGVWLVAFFVFVVIVLFRPYSVYHIPNNNIYFFAIPSLVAALFMIRWFNHNHNDYSKEGVRYIEYGITAPLLAVAIVTALIPDITTNVLCLIYVAICVLNLAAAASMYSEIFSLLTYNQSLSFCASWVLFFASCIPLYFSLTSHFTIKYAPMVAWVAVAILGIGYLSFGVIHLIWKLMDYSQKNYIMILDVLSMLVKTSLTLIALTSTLFANGRSCLN